MKKLLLRIGVALLIASLPMAVHAVNVTLTVSQIVKTGLNTLTGSNYTTTGLLTTNTYKFSNDGKIFLHFEKTGATTAVVTIVTPGTAHGLAIADVTVNVDAIAGDVFIGPFPISLFNDSSGIVSFTFDNTAGLSLAAFRL